MTKVGWRREKGDASKWVINPASNLPQKRYAVNSDNIVLTFQHPDRFEDPLTSVLRDGAWLLLTQAVKTDAEAFLASMKKECLRRPHPCRVAWPQSEARDPDRHQPDAGEAAQTARPWRR